MVDSILTLDPEKRPSLNQILEHDFFHMGSAIPKNLPRSTLACPPKESFIKQFMDDNPKSARGPKPAHRMGETAPTGFFTSRDKENGSKKDKKEEQLSKSTLTEIKRDTNVLEYVDYSSKYGVGYLLSDNSFGVFFNDSTKILYDPEEKLFHYLDRKQGD